MTFSDAKERFSTRVSYFARLYYGQLQAGA